jgi:hypothetical protein
MAHWAEIDENNLVIQVLVTSNDEPDEGYQWLIDNLGGRWIKTSYNTVGGVHLNNGVPLRKNFAGIGYIYDETRDAFIPPKPEKIAPKRDYILDETTCTWILEEAVVEEAVAEVVVSQEEIPE